MALRSLVQAFSLVRVQPARLLSTPSMFAVVDVKGHQFKVAPGDQIVTEKVEAGIGTQIDLEQVLLVGSATETIVGQPSIAGAVVKATVEQQTKSGKVFVFKKQRRKNYRRFRGHRQEVSVLRVDDIIHT
eukprot:CAMPEP_0113883588 /NCGR_PEP_ID=MMETSP0780_2-20120614/9703_1 /TAXON_ID=652834 /ORGANISM="Palpitomonas bilix" /LENGTH=129 /DNA_ID=CAMNT_0000870949 /DNA_START=258 /DNA_END=647 /DNA_ORIENTATION=- /assembly_acc=CAM_ASM_000599